MVADAPRDNLLASLASPRRPRANLFALQASPWSIFTSANSASRSLVSENGSMSETEEASSCTHAISSHVKSQIDYTFMLASFNL